MQSVLVFFALQNAHLGLFCMTKSVALLGRVGVRRETNDGKVHQALAFNSDLVKKMLSSTCVAQYSSLRG